MVFTSSKLPGGGYQPKRNGEDTTEKISPPPKQNASQ
jgi:hypothetical protein